MLGIGPTSVLRGPPFRAAIGGRDAFALTIVCTELSAVIAGAVERSALGDAATNGHDLEKGVLYL